MTRKIGLEAIVLLDQGLRIYWTVGLTLLCENILTAFLLVSRMFHPSGRIHSPFHTWAKNPLPPTNKAKYKMGLKRSHEDSHGHETMHPSRQATLQPQSKSHPRKKPRRFEPPTFNSKSVNPLKKKIRDISRLLDRSDNLPADVRLSNERALKAYQQDLLAAEQERRRQKMIKKYHMVRFFGELSRPASIKRSLNVARKRDRRQRDC